MEKRRYDEIDVLRGLAIVLMVITHINGIFIKYSSNPLDLFTYLGATVCFTVFLFCFSFLYGLKRDKVEGKYIFKSIKRGVIMLMIYYLLAILVHTLHFRGISLTEVYSILVFRTIPQYTEYIITFVWLMILFPFIEMIFRKVWNNYVWGILIVLAFIASYLIQFFPRDGTLGYYFQFIFGTISENHTFGIIAYLPVILLGYLWGSLFDRDELNSNNKVKFSVVILIALLGIEYASKYVFHMEWQRWPPNTFFIVSGLIFVFTVLSLYYAVGYFRKMSWFLENVGRYATQYLVAHIVIIYIIEYLLNHAKLDEIFLPIIFFFIFIFMEFLKKFTYKDDYKYKWRLSYVGILSVFLLIIALITSYRRLAIAVEEPGNTDKKPEDICASYEEYFKDPFLSISKNRKWFLKDYYKEDNLTDLYVEGAFKDSTNENGRELLIYGGNLIITDESGSEDFVASNTIVSIAEDRSFGVTIDTQTYPVSNYGYKLIFSTECGNIESSKYTFNISEPVYVSWTIDWEGTDIPKGHLKDMEEISDKYKVPMTHFFNPRYYVTKTHAKEYTDWVLRRYALGDDIGMHIHMYKDMVTAAGVTPKAKPNWGQNTPIGGYDILVTAYSYEEQLKIFSWGRNALIQNGIPSPILYRSGGWFANLDTLRAAYDAGFLADSSGRTQFSIGFNKATVAWNLKSTTQPYFPSQTDQNKPSKSPIGILEIPNNGGDSWAFSEDQMYGRFRSNFNGQPVTEKKLVTFLSHPEWFYTDKPKLEGLFTDIAKYLYDNDKGPVVFINQTTAYKIWSN